MRIMQKQYAYDHPMYSAIWHHHQRSPGNKFERTSTMQQLRKIEQRDVFLHVISSQNKIDKSNENQEEMKNFVKETVGNQLKNEIASFKSAVESNLNELGDIVTKKVKSKTEPLTNDHPAAYVYVEYPS